MAERELHPDGEQRRRIMDFIMAAGQTLLENGAEVSPGTICFPSKVTGFPPWAAL